MASRMPRMGVGIILIIVCIGTVSWGSFFYETTHLGALLKKAPGLSTNKDVVHCNNSIDSVTSKTVAHGTNISLQESLPQQQHLLTIVTACTQNHLLETIESLQTLIKTKCPSPIVMYLISTPTSSISQEERTELLQELNKSPLNIRLVDLDFQVLESIRTYCFKPKVVHHYLFDAAWHNRKPKILMWSDASTRFRENPEIWARNMLQDNVDFSGRWAPSNMRDYVHPDTYKFFNVSTDDYYKQDKPPNDIASTHFLINLMRTGAQDQILLPWLDCGVSSCTTCMAPIGSYKTSETEVRPDLPGVRHMHRQDQSVLSLLALEYKKKKGNVQVGNQKYLNVDTNRGLVKLQNITQLNGNVTKNPGS